MIHKFFIKEYLLIFNIHNLIGFIPEQRIIHFKSWIYI